ncbi:MAG: TfoX/Sxy family protein [Chloroflexi bacterium]|nr:TfoX/Sxy family protein [Chloroflexota bacterium]
MFESAQKDFPIAERRQVFGSPAALVNGNMFTGLQNDKMILRVSDADAAALRQEHNAKPFEPMPGRAMKDWIALSQSLLDDAREWNVWMQRAFGHTQALPPKK